MGATINARMGLNTWAAFTGTDDKAAIAGDVAMLESEVTPVLKALRKNGLEVVAIHHHMTADRADDHLRPLLGDGTGRQARNRFQGRGERARQAWRRLDAMTTATDSLHSQEPSATSPLRSLGFDGRLLFATRFIRLFAYGGLSVVLVLYLVGLGLSESDTGLLLTCTLLGDTCISLYLTTQADRIGRRRMLIIGASLMAAAGVAFALTSRMWLLVVAGTIGVISPSGQEVGPFLSIEQAALSQVVTDRNRTHVFAWYTMAGSLADRARRIGGGLLTQALQQTWTPVDSYRAVVIGYALIGIGLAIIFVLISKAIGRGHRASRTRLGRRSRASPESTAHTGW